MFSSSPCESQKTVNISFSEVGCIWTLCWRANEDVFIPYSGIYSVAVNGGSMFHLPWRFFSRNDHLQHHSDPKAVCRCPNVSFVQFLGWLWVPSYTDFMEGKPVLDNFIGCTVTKLQLMCHFINSHPSVLQDHVMDSFRVVISNRRGCVFGSFRILTLRRPFLNLSIHSQTIRCDTPLFPHCTDILLCVSGPGIPSAHKKQINVPFSSLASMKSVASKFMARSLQHRSHLHHNGRREVDHAYHVMPSQQCSQLQNMYLQCR